MLRHGQSTWNADGRWQGRADPPLSDLGTRQAKAAALALGQFDAVVASSLERARHTADVIAHELGIGPVATDPDLMERCAGEWEGSTKAEIEQRWPGWLAAGRTPEGWEPDEVVVERASRAIGRIAAGVGDEGTALVISHGGVIRSLMAALGRDDVRYSNLDGQWFEIAPGHFRAGDLVQVLADATVSDTI